MNKSEVYAAITEWEQDAGESLLDQGFHLKESTFMTWCYGKGYLTSTQYNAWLSDWTRNKLEAMDANYYVYDSSGDVPYAVVSSDEWDERSQTTAYEVLAEFIAGIDVYTERLRKFIAGEDE